MTVDPELEYLYFQLIYERLVLIFHFLCNS